MEDSEASRILSLIFILVSIILPVGAVFQQPILPHLPSDSPDIPPASSFEKVVLNNQIEGHYRKYPLQEALGYSMSAYETISTSPPYQTGNYITPTATGLGHHCPTAIYKPGIQDVDDRVPHKMKVSMSPTSRPESVAMKGATYTASDGSITVGGSTISVVTVTVITETVINHTPATIFPGYIGPVPVITNWTDWGLESPTGSPAVSTHGLFQM